MIHRIELKNFKGFADAALNLGRVTVLLGPNSAGKSTWMQAVQVLRQTLEQRSYWRPIWDGPHASLGGFMNVVHQHDDNRAVQIGVVVGGGGGHRQGCVMEADRWGVVRYRVGPVNAEGGLVGDGVVLTQRDRDEATPRHVQLFEIEADSYRRVYGVSEHWVDWWANNSASVSVWLEIGVGVCVVRASAAHSAIEGGDTPEMDVGLDKGMSSRRPQAPDGGKMTFKQNFVSFQNAIEGMQPPLASVTTREVGSAPDALRKLLVRPADVLELVSTVLSGTRFIAGLRLPGQRWVATEGPAPDSVGASGEHLVQVLGASSVVLGSVNLAFQDIGVPYEVGVLSTPPGAPHASVVQLLAQGGERVGLSDVGSGIRQVLPVLAEFGRMIQPEATLSVRDTLFIEQPELHLHPRWQGALACWLAGARRTRTESGPAAERDDAGEPVALKLCWHRRTSVVPQVVIETHSEVQVRRLARMVFNGLLQSSEVALAVIHDRRLQVVPISPGGDIDWKVDGLKFFREQFEELEP